MTGSVILFLREVLEAMLIVCLLLAAMVNLRISRKWILLGMLLGLAGAGIYGLGFDAIGELYDGVGQEVVNATLLFMICLSLALFSGFVMSRRSRGDAGWPLWTGIGAALMAIAFAVTREGAELYIYLSGFLNGSESLPTIIIGGAIGSGIGLSIGTIIYFAIRTLETRAGLMACSLLMIPLAAGMASQACNYLMQADLLPSQQPLWDSSFMISESSIVGELLYAVFSYEATPAPLQVAIYLSTFVLLSIGLTAIVKRTGKPLVKRP